MSFSLAARNKHNNENTWFTKLNRSIQPIHNDNKWKQKYVKEFDKRKSHTNSKLQMIYISSNNDRHPVTENFTALHPATLHSTSLHLLILQLLSLKLHPTTLHLLSLKLNPTTLHLLSLKLHPTTLHCTLIWLNAIQISHCFERIPQNHVRLVHL